VYQDYAAVLSKLHPNVHFRGEVFMPPQWKQMLAQLCSTLFVAGLATMFVGHMFLPASISNMINNNKAIFVVGIFLLNMLGSGLLSSGAFEVHTDGMLVFSKIAEQRMPTAKELSALIATALEEH